MHPPRRSNVGERPGLVDRTADWLLTHCPFTTLTLLTMLVIASVVSFERPWIVVSVAIAADLAFGSLRFARRASRTVRRRPQAAA